MIKLELHQRVTFTFTFGRKNQRSLYSTLVTFARVNTCHRIWIIADELASRDSRINLLHPNYCDSIISFKKLYGLPKQEKEAILLSKLVPCKVGAKAPFLTVTTGPLQSNSLEIERSNKHIFSQSRSLNTQHVHKEITEDASVNLDRGNHVSEFWGEVFATTRDSVDV